MDWQTPAGMRTVCIMNEGMDVRTVCTRICLPTKDMNFDF